MYDSISKDCSNSTCFVSLEIGWHRLPTFRWYCSSDLFGRDVLKFGLTRSQNNVHKVVAVLGSDRET